MSRFLAAIVLSVSTLSHAVALEANERPNLLLIMVDDLNDWVGCLDGHPQVRTPNIDRLAKRGMLFTNAHVQATYCGPSRVSFLSGRYPQTTGCYGFERYSKLDSLQNHPPFPLHLRRHGYQTFGGGKIFHHGTGGGWVTECWDNVWKIGRNPRPRERMNWPKAVWDWGAYPQSDEQMGDFQLARAAAKALQREHSAPFLMVTGFRRPHVPLHVPARWFELYPLEDIALPAVPGDDLDDVPHPEMGLENYAAPKHSQVVEQELWRSLVQAYLASISFVDHCVGELLRGLNAGPNRENTIVVLVSDHGFHLGEKQHWAKRTLWEETTRVPMMIAGPGIKSGRRVSAPVGLIDIYPTLCELSGVPEPAGLEGKSLQPLLGSDSGGSQSPAFTTFKPGDITVRSEHWRYTRYPDGTEELYDHQNDPNEWQNLVGVAEFDAVKEKLAKSALTHLNPERNVR